ncbi:TlpA family protein disulfide reductase [Rhizobium sp. P32RR-XVIII]|uniref:peroxiredoxin family protein n=1 Tax=Rhizobium sp. P32RR-XVIII TaxID=2726738 RepID=UPI0014576C2D|nr:TlpA family protein disulfide reductase [Rhizobium sp. P32RR-XVIII]NLS07587.1 TlpA family protein disulfide reductase [Rhizobium sp. P32RR-XVIII]
MKYGISGRPAPELFVPYWINAEGMHCPPVTLSSLGQRHRVLFFYQHWCPGCHSHGFPALLSLIERTRDRDVAYAVVQTVFEGAETNTPERLSEDQRRYDLRIPFGHEGRLPGHRLPTTMENYRTGGTPWFVAVDPAGVVLQDGFAIAAEEFIAAVDKARAPT